MTTTIRDAHPDDLPAILQMVRDLAAFERMADQVVFDGAEFGRHVFGPDPVVTVDIAEVDGEVAGMALWFRSFSTFLGKPGIWLEDLFVDPDARGSGLGRALLSRLAGLVVERGGARLEWAVLDWNELGKGFYRSIGAGPVDGWERWRMEIGAIEVLARGV